MTINNNINSLYVFQSDEIDSIKDKQNVYIWNGHQDKANFISIPKYLERNANRIKKKYIEFIYDLGKKNILNKNLIQHLKINNNYNLWWMSLLTEKSHYKSSKIKDCLKLFALEEIIINKKPDKIFLYFSDQTTVDAISNLVKNLNINFTLKKVSPNENYKHNFKSIFHFIYCKSPNPIKAIIYLIRNIFVYWPLKKVSKVEWFKKKKSIFFLSYMFHLDPIKFSEGKYKTGQWGPITELLPNLSIKTNWMHHFIPNILVPNTKIATNFINKLNNNSEINGVHQFILGHLNIIILFKVILNYFKILFKFPVILKFKNSFKPSRSKICFWHLLKKDFVNSIIGPKSIENLLWIELFDYAFSIIPHQEKGIYLQENQGWEKAFIMSWKNHKHGKLIGLNNGFVRFWDTRFFEDKRNFEDTSDCKLPSPDFIILTDKVSWNSYLDSGYPENKLIKAETIRYFDACLNQSEKKQIFSYGKETKLKTLILGDIIHETTDNMIKILEKIIRKEDFNWTIKSHPACPINITNYQNIKLENSNNNLKDIVSEFNVVVAPAATLSVLEAYLKNINVIIYLDKNEINLSPLRNFPEVKFAYDLNTMNKAFDINEIKNLLNKKQNLFWFDKDLTLWKKILN